MTGMSSPLDAFGGKPPTIRVGAAALMTLALTVLVMRPFAVSAADHQAAVAPTVSGERLISDTGAPVDIASDGTNFLVVGEDGSSVVGILVNPAGEVLAGPFPIAAGSATKLDAVVAWSGIAYGVVWEQYNGQQRDIYFAEVSATGSVSAPTPVVSGVADQFDPALVYAGSERWLAYSEFHDDPEPGEDVVSIVLATTGSSSVVASLTGSVGRAFTEPDLAWDDDHNRFLTAWNNAHTGGIDARRFDVATRTSIGAAFATAGGLHAHPAVAWNGSDRWAIVWDDYRFSPTSFDIYGTLVHADGTILADGTPIFVGPGDQRTPDIAWNTQEFVVIWRDTQSSSTSDLYGTTLASDGTVEDEPFVVAASEGLEGIPTISAGPATKIGISYAYFGGPDGIYFRTSPK